MKAYKSATVLTRTKIITTNQIIEQMNQFNNLENYIGYDKICTDIK